MKPLAALCLTLTCFTAGARSISHYGLFPTIDHSGTISRRFDYSLYYFAGLNLVNDKVNGKEDPANFFVLYAEQALTYKVNEHLSFTGSYVYERQRPIENSYRNEDRFYVQTAYQYHLSRTVLKHRLRFDGRFIENRSLGAAPFTSRLRYQFGLTTPLNKHSDKLYLSAYNEFFFNPSKNAISIYEENWAYAGVGLKTKTGNFEIGPLYIFWVNNRESDLTNFYYLQFTWISHLDFRKKAN